MNYAIPRPRKVVVWMLGDNGNQFPLSIACLKLKALLNTKIYHYQLTSKGNSYTYGVMCRVIWWE
jgi:hypothetical protein